MNVVRGKNSRIKIPLWRLGLIWARRIFLGQRFRPLLVVGLYGFLIFPIFRLLLFLIRHEFVKDITWNEIGRCFGYGMQFDAVVVGWCLLPAAVILSVSPVEYFSRGWFKKLITIYGTVIMFTWLAIEVVGLFFFLDFRRRLNWASIAYWSNPREVCVYLWRNYTWGFLILLPAALCIFYGVYKFLMRYFWRGKIVANTLRARIIQTIAIMALCVILCRGTLERIPLRPGSETHSPNNVVNQLSLNNAFSLVYAAKSMFYDGMDESKFHDFPDPKEAWQLTMQMLEEPGQVADCTPFEPVRRLVDTEKTRQNLNVVFIIMEGQSSYPVGALGYPDSKTPFLDELATQSLFCSNMYAVGERTCRGVIASLCGHPDLNENSLLKRSDAMGSITTLPGIFEQRGYNTMFIYGGDPKFDNMEQFLRAGGIKTVIGQEEIDSQKAGNWGVPDKLLFDKTHQVLTEAAKEDKKFFAVVITTSNHQPYEIPFDAPIKYLPNTSYKNKIFNGYRYADWAIKDFFDKARNAPYFKDTLFVLVADHGHGKLMSIEKNIDVPNYRIPCVFYSPGIVTPQRIECVTSQADVPATVLGIMGGTYYNSFFGRDVTKIKPDNGFAFLHEGRSLGFVQGNLAIVLPPRNNREEPHPVPVLFRITPYTMTPIDPRRAGEDVYESMKQKALSFYWTALQEYITIKSIKQSRQQ